jgi:hypothetical protein
MNSKLNIQWNYCDTLENKLEIVDVGLSGFNW